MRRQKRWGGELGGGRGVSLGSVAWVLGGERRSWRVGVWWWQLAATSSFAQAFGASTAVSTRASWPREHSWHPWCPIGPEARPLFERNPPKRASCVSPSFTYVHLFSPRGVKIFTSHKKHSKTNGFCVFTFFTYVFSPTIFTRFHLPVFGGFRFFAASSCNPLVVVQVCLTNDSRHNLFQRVHGFGHGRDELLVFLGEIRLREHFPKLLRRVYQDLAVRVR